MTHYMLSSPAAAAAAAAGLRASPLCRRHHSFVPAPHRSGRVSVGSPLLSAAAARSVGAAMAAAEGNLNVTGRKQVLISLSDKTDLAYLGNGLQGLGYSIVSTGGTASSLETAGVNVTKVEEITHFPEMLDGRVKTLHPSIHGGILARRDQEHHLKALKEHGIGTFDVVVVNLYPFYDKVTSGAICFEDGIENIDIGGPTLIRAAAKNHKDVLVVVDHKDYPALLEYLQGNQDDQQFRKMLAWKAFQHVASYDSAVSEWLWKQSHKGHTFPPSFTVPLSLKSTLRYGENPHQKAAFYADKSLSLVSAGGIATAIQHHGREMSYNNYLDADAAWNCVSEFDSPTCVSLLSPEAVSGTRTPSSVAISTACLSSSPASGTSSINLKVHGCSFQLRKWCTQKAVESSYKAQNIVDNCYTLTLHCSCSSKKIYIVLVVCFHFRFFIHLLMAYVFTFWTCFMLYKEYSNVAFMRLHFLASQKRCADQFAVIVRNIPHVSSHSKSETVDEFFRRNHPDHYLGQQAVYNANRYAKLVKQKERLQNWLDYYQLKFERHPDKRPIGRTGCLGFCGREVDQIDYYRARISELDKRIASERQKVLNDPKAVMPVAFVTFDSRWGAAVCAQTQQSKNPTQWLTDWAPEPRDVYWQNLAIPFFSLSIRKFLISVAVFALVFFYMIPIAFVQSLANLEGIEKVAPFLRPVIEVKVVKSFLQGFLPGLALKIFLYILPTVLMIMSKVEGYVSLSSLERRAASKYYYFMLVNVFLGSIIAGTAFEQLYAFFHQPPTQIPRTIGVAIPMKATFFMTYIMVDGWAGIANEILRVKPLVIYHLKNMFIVKTERDREKAMDPGSIGLAENLPALQLYFLLGLVYAVVTPILLPFIIIFFAFAFLVYRHQIINVYNQEYESAAAFWPQVHSRIIASLLISHVTLFGLLSTMKAAYSTPLLIFLPLLTIWFHKYCKSRFEPAFRKYPLEEAMEKDNMERASEPNLNLKSFLANAYLHPIFHLFEEEKEETVEVRIDKPQQQQHEHEETRVRSSQSQYQETHFRSAQTQYHEETRIRSSQYHEETHIRSDTDSPSPRHFVYHYEIEP